jgi:hypothetical protein
MLSEEDLKEFYEEQLRQRQKEYAKTKSNLIDEQIELLQKLAGNQIKILMGLK